MRSNVRIDGEEDLESSSLFSVHNFVPVLFITLSVTVPNSPSNMPPC